MELTSQGVHIFSLLNNIIRTKAHFFKDELTRISLMFECQNLLSARNRHYNNKVEYIYIN